MKALPLAVTSVVVVSIIAGFFLIGSPLTQRVRRFDERRVSDLQTIQWEVVNYWQRKSALPASLDDLRDEIRGFVPPTDPVTGLPYEYSSEGTVPLRDTMFGLCAVFSMPSAAGVSHPVSKGMENDNWAHDAGRTCFKRTIDKDLYPPFPNKLAPVIQ